MVLAMLVALTVWMQAGGVAFESDLWPEEGIPVFEAVATQLSLHELPSASSKVIRRLTVKAKQRLVFDETRYRTMTPGRLTALVSATIKGRMLGDVTRLSKADYYSDTFPEASVDVSAGDIVEYLQYRAEGTCFVRVAGKTIDAAPCPTHTKAFRLDVKPSLEWWVHTTVRVIDRKG